LKFCGVAFSLTCFRHVLRHLISVHNVRVINARMITIPARTAFCSKKKMD